MGNLLKSKFLFTMFTGNSNKTFLGVEGLGLPTAPKSYLDANLNSNSFGNWSYREGAAIAAWIYELDFGNTPKSGGVRPEDGLPEGWSILRDSSGKPRYFSDNDLDG